jgi:glycosyltransferase involved in cell wall biosynthesis
VTYKVVFYCPDRHLTYDGRTPRETGIGGGITARVRMAEALARAGHDVTSIINCSHAHVYQNVNYIPLDEAETIDTQILIMNTSGDRYDLLPILDLKPRASLRIVWVSGTDKPGGLDSVGFNFIYAKSNFLREVVLKDWGVPKEKIFVSYNMFPAEYFNQARYRSPERDPYRLIYFSHPSKGLDAAIDVLRRLREIDDRFRLFVYGGNKLWAQEDGDIPSLPGFEYHGLLGQEALVAEIFKSTYSLNLQNRREPFPNAVLEAMRAGCVIIASAVGAYPEIIQQGWNGFVIPGDANEDEARSAAAHLIAELSRHPELVSLIGCNAATIPWDGQRMVQTWQRHWDSLLEEDGGAASPPIDALLACPGCDSSLSLYPDGYRCSRCGRYYRILPA